MLHATVSSASSLPPHQNPLAPPSISPQPPLAIYFRTTHRKNLRYLKFIGIIPPSHKFFPQQTLPQSSPSSISSNPRASQTQTSKNLPPSPPPKLFSFSDIEPSSNSSPSLGLILGCLDLLFSKAEFCLQKLNSPTTLNAHLLNTRVGRLVERVRFLEEFGFSYEESRSFCFRLPANFGYSVENDLRPKFEYLVEEMERRVDELNKFLQYFGFSLKGRIVTRHLHLKERDVQVLLNRMLLWMIKDFTQNGSEFGME